MPGILMSSRARSQRWRGSFSNASRALLAVSTTVAFFLKPFSQRVPDDVLVVHH